MWPLNILKNIPGIIGTIMPSQTSTSVIPQYATWMSYMTFAVRLLLLFVVGYVMLVWPVDIYDGAGFDTWSARMAALPENVWYLIYTILGLWGTTEVVSTRARNAVRMKAMDAFAATETSGPPPDPLAEETPGTAATHTEAAEDFLSMPVQPNPSLEAWRNNAAG